MTEPAASAAGTAPARATEQVPLPTGAMEKIITAAGLEVKELSGKKWRVNRPGATAAQFAYFDVEGIAALVLDIRDGNTEALAKKVPAVKAAAKRKAATITKGAAKKAVSKKKQTTKKKGATKASKKAAATGDSIFTASGAFRTPLTFNPNRFRRMIKRELKQHILACTRETERFSKLGATEAQLKKFTDKYQKPAAQELADRESGKVERFGRAALPDSTPDSKLPPFGAIPGQDTGLRKVLSQQRATAREARAKEKKAAQGNGKKKAAKTNSSGNGASRKAGPLLKPSQKKARKK